MLKAFFNLIEVLEAIRRQSSYEVLHVDGYRYFHVEWHLRKHLKTLKCMYSVSNDKNARLSCFYCMHGQKKENLGRNVWDNGIGINDSPSCDGIVNCGGNWVPSNANWDPMLPIPLARLHFCILHAIVRIVENIVHLYIYFSYTM